jgi:hypothetical protein
MLRQWRQEGQELVVSLRSNPHDPDNQIRIKVCNQDVHSGRVEVGITATQSWEIYRAESPRTVQGDK